MLCSVCYCSAGHWSTANAMRDGGGVAGEGGGNPVELTAVEEALGSPHKLWDRDNSVNKRAARRSQSDLYEASRRLELEQQR